MINILFKHVELDSIRLETYAFVMKIWRKCVFVKLKSIAKIF